MTHTGALGPAQQLGGPGLSLSYSTCDAVVMLEATLIHAHRFPGVDAVGRLLS